MRRQSNARGQRGSLTQLDDGRWLAKYREGGRGSRRPQRIFGRNEKRAAAGWLRDRIAETEAPTTTTAEDLTLDVLCDRYLSVHEADDVTVQKLREQLRPVRRKFGARPVSGLADFELRAYRKTLKPAYAFEVFRALRQVCRAGAAGNWIPSDPCVNVPNPRPRRKEVQIPTWATVEAIADEIDSWLAALPILGAGAGLRLEELLALERRDVDLDGRLIRVRRVWSSGRLVELGADGSKTHRQRRNVPLRGRVADALRGHVPRIDTPLLFPAPAGGYLDTTNLGARHWRPAIVAAGVDYFPAKDLRHLYASEMLDAGTSLYTLSRRMGTSVRMIEQTYGHLVDDADEQELVRMDAYDAARNERAKARSER